MRFAPPITPEQFDALPPEFQAILQGVIDHYEKRIAAVEAKLAAARQTPHSSSQPFSSEHLHAKPPAAKSKSKRKRGGRPGHPKQERALIPTEQCQQVVTGIEPTNNVGERALRPVVIWRKRSFGTPSERGNRFVETRLTVVETCRQQSCNVFAFVTTAINAQFHRQTAPSIIRV